MYCMTVPDMNFKLSVLYMPFKTKPYYKPGRGDVHISV